MKVSGNITETFYLDKNFYNFYKLNYIDSLFF